MDESPTAPIDYRALLLKYLGYVARIEGTTFLPVELDDVFTDEEELELIAIDAELTDNKGDPK